MGAAVVFAFVLGLLLGWVLRSPAVVGWFRGAVPFHWRGSLDGLSRSQRQAIRDRMAELRTARPSRRCW